MNSNLNNGVSMFTLQNSRGEVVDLDSDDLFGYTPTGLGAVFSNYYSQYDSYFKPTKKTIQQGQMSLNILFGSVESNSYQTFSDFASFLAYEPLTLIYTTKSESWYRDAVLSSLTKTEIGGTTVIQVDRLVEQFTIDFINPWYNNKTAEYKSYDPDAGLATFGKVYGTSINPALFSSNLVLNSNQSISSGALVPMYSELPLSQYSGKIITMSFQVDIDKVTTLSGKKRVVFEIVLVDETGKNNYYTVSKSDFSVGDSFHGRVSATMNLNQKKFKDADKNSLSEGLFVQGVVAVNLSISKPKIEIGSLATPWTPAVSESKTTWNYGYFNVNSETIKKNQAYADLAKTDITYIEN